MKLPHFFLVLALAPALAASDAPAPPCSAKAPAEEALWRLGQALPSLRPDAGRRTLSLVLTGPGCDAEGPPVSRSQVCSANPSKGEIRCSGEVLAALQEDREREAPGPGLLFVLAHEVGHVLGEHSERLGTAGQEVDLSLTRIEKASLVRHALSEIEQALADEAEADAFAIDALRHLMVDAPEKHNATSQQGAGLEAGHQLMVLEQLAKDFPGDTSTRPGGAEGSGAELGRDMLCALGGTTGTLRLPRFAITHPSWPSRIARVHRALHRHFETLNEPDRRLGEIEPRTPSPGDPIGEFGGKGLGKLFGAINEIVPALEDTMASELQATRTFLRKNLRYWRRDSRDFCETPELTPAANEEEASRCPPFTVATDARQTWSATPRPFEVEAVDAGRFRLADAVSGLWSRPDSDEVVLAISGSRELVRWKVGAAQATSWSVSAEVASGDWDGRRVLVAGNDPAWVGMFVPGAGGWIQRLTAPGGTLPGRLEITAATLSGARPAVVAHTPNSPVAVLTLGDQTWSPAPVWTEDDCEDLLIGGVRAVIPGATAGVSVVEDANFHLEFFDEDFSERTGTLSPSEIRFFGSGEEGPPANLVGIGPWGGSRPFAFLEADGTLLAGSEVEPVKGMPSLSFLGAAQLDYGESEVVGAQRSVFVLEVSEGDDESPNRILAFLRGDLGGDEVAFLDTVLGERYGLVRIGDRALYWWVKAGQTFLQLYPAPP